METFPVLIEIPKGTVNNKFEFDHKTNKMVLDFVFTDLVWPFNYGEIVGTLGGDGDALDAMVFSSKPLEQSAVVQCVPFGIVKMLDRGEVDDKLMMLPADDALTKKYRDLEDFSETDREMITKLYTQISAQKKKTIEILEFKNKQAAIDEIKKSLT